MIHHLDCGTMRPPLTGGGRLFPRRLVAHCLLVERPEGLLLVDSGFGRDDVAAPARLGRPFVFTAGPDLDLAQTAHARVTALGHSPDDVTDVVLTHLDLDHAGGLADFPHARVHVHDTELSAALAPTRRERPRYVAAQWAHGPQWVRHTARGESWRGFEAVTVLGDDVLLVPLHGHTRGHCGVAVRRPDGGWLLHAGDSYFSAGEKQTPPSAPPGIRAYQRLMGVDDAQRVANAALVRELHATQSGEVTVFSAHDAEELAALASP